MDVKYVPNACYSGKDGQKFYQYIRSYRIFQNGSETLATLLSVITRMGRRV